MVPCSRVSWASDMPRKGVGDGLLPPITLRVAGRGDIWKFDLQLVVDAFHRGVG